MISRCLLQGESIQSFSDRFAKSCRLLMNQIHQIMRMVDHQWEVKYFHDMKDLPVIKIFHAVLTCEFKTQELRDQGNRNIGRGSRGGTIP